MAEQKVDRTALARVGKKVDAKADTLDMLTVALSAFLTDGTLAARLVVQMVEMTVAQWAYYLADAWVWTKVTR
jgi:uncharacterized lipoprotein NlpE involved in copper resistance